MKFKVYTYDSRVNKRRNTNIGRFEIYNEKGECVATSGKRRVANYVPDTENYSLSFNLIRDMAGIDKRFKVDQLDAPNQGRPRSRYYTDDDDQNEYVFEVECV